MKRPGRPALDPSDPSVQVCVVIPGKQYDVLFSRAMRERVTVPELIRRSITDQPKEPKKIA